MSGCGGGASGLRVPELEKIVPMSDEAPHEPAEMPAPATPSVEPAHAADADLFTDHPATAAPPAASLDTDAPTWSFGSSRRSKPPSSGMRRWEAVWLGLATGVSLLAAPIGFVAAILSPMVFDPKQNLWNPAAWIAFFLIISFWMVCIAAPYGAWVAYLRRLRVMTWLAMAAPLVWVVATVASVSFLPG